MNTENVTKYINSLYNFYVPLTEGVLLYNSNTGAVLRFDDRDALELAKLLSGRQIEIPFGPIPNDVFHQLSQGGFIVSSQIDEVLEIRKRYNFARTGTPIVLTLTTTMDCNLGCYYCYEERSQSKLEIEDVEAIVNLASDRLSRNGKKNLHIDWYGGEPLMNLEFMEAASLALQDMCKRENIGYVASVISNGTCWPNDIDIFINKHKIQQVQISFDGLQENHERRRRYRKNYKPDDDISSFTQAVDLVDQLLDHTQVDIRLNVDRVNQEDVIPFIKFARSRGWFNRRFKAVIQPARLASYSERSSFMRKSELTLDEFDDVRKLVRAEVGLDAPVEESEAPEGFPYPKTSVCAALAKDSVVVGADNRQYRCGLQVSEPHRAVGDLHSAKNPFLQRQEQKEEQKWWNEFDPTKLPTCSRCSFLPICWGGCPKKHLEQDKHAIAEQGMYWRKNLPRLIAAGVGAETELPDGYVFSEIDQFRLD